MHLYSENDSISAVCLWPTNKHGVVIIQAVRSQTFHPYCVISRDDIGQFVQQNDVSFVIASSVISRNNMM